MFVSLILILLFVLYIYFGLVRPQRKQFNKRAVMLNSIKKGNLLYTVDGIRGQVESLKGRELLLLCFPDMRPVFFDIESVDRIENYNEEAAKAKMQAKIGRNYRKR